jgi:general stress protein 26
MEKRALLNILESILDEVKTAILATVDAEGRPSMRWVSPAVVRGRAGALYMVTSAKSKKVQHLKSNPQVQWLFQTRALDRIITVDGRVNVVDNPSIRAEVLEVVGPRLRPFWKINMEERDLLVLETIIEVATYYVPMKGVMEELKF